jgi:hypothetical protein
MMGPSREHGIVETTHLVEQTFEETLAAPPGLAMADLIPTILFFREGTLVGRVVGAAPKAVLQAIVSARAS